MAKHPLAAVVRALAVLEILAERGGARFGELREALDGIGPASLTRLLDVLAEQGYVRKEGALYVLARSIGHASPWIARLMWHRAEIEAILAELSTGTGLPSAVFVRLREDAMAIAGVHQVPEQSAFQPRGEELPLYPFHGFAQVFLAWSRPELQERMFHAWYAKADRTAAAERRYRAKLAEIKRLGRAVEDREQHDHLARICVPLIPPGEAPQGVLGVIGFPEIVARADEIVDRLRTAGDRMLRTVTPEEDPAGRPA